MLLEARPAIFALGVMVSRCALALCLCAMLRASFAAPTLPVGEADWYYQLGGGSPVLNFSDGATVTRLKLLDNDLRWSLSACKGFSVSKSVKNHFKDIRQNVYALEKNVIDSARSLLQVSALSVLQRANPGIYDLVTRGIVSGRAAFDVAVKNCEQIQRDVDAGRNPLHGWLRVASYMDWRADIGSEDPVEKRKKIDEAPGSKGIPWLGGDAGGVKQKPIQVTGDLVKAGYKVWRPEDKPEASKNLATLWPDAETAAQWARSVLGETEIRFCKRCQKYRSRPGAGLQREIHQGAATAAQTLRELVAAEGRPDAERMRSLDASGMGIAVHAELIDALREEHPANREIMLKRLATEIALAGALEKALVARQLLRSGGRLPNAATNEQAQRELEQLLERLDEEIDNVLFEQRVRREALTPTASAMLKRRRAAALPSPHRQLSLPLGAGGAKRVESPERP